MHGRSLQPSSDSVEYAAEEFLFTPTVCGEENDNSMPFGMLPDKVLSSPIMRIRKLLFPPSFEGITQNGRVQEVF